MSQRTDGETGGNRTDGRVRGQLANYLYIFLVNVSVASLGP